jgi:hypothetical protein
MEAQQYTNEGFPPPADCSLLDWMLLFRLQCPPSPQRPKHEDTMTKEEKYNFNVLLRQYQHD